MSSRTDSFLRGKGPVLLAALVLTPLQMGQDSSSSGCSGGAQSNSQTMTCPEGEYPYNGKCVTITCGQGTGELEGKCVRDDLRLAACEDFCLEAECGDDGCGRSCGTCPTAKPFCVRNSCADTCTAACTGKVCGDDGCNGSCGECADGTMCAPDGHACVPKAYTCAPATYNDGKTCDCKCGAPDPDCTDTTRAAVGCDANQICGADSTCVTPCMPSCSGKTCGPDGCGGDCGSCPETAMFCNSGTCSATCAPQCTNKTCGDDGCNGSCGSCAAGERCNAGKCETVPAEASCKNNCGGKASGGCSCAPSCVTTGNCCVDAEDLCGCFPRCDGKSCGDNGCGGSCGTCDAGSACADGKCVANKCGANACSGHGTCAPASGACTCAVGFSGVNCDQCADGFAGYPSCTKSKCSTYSCNRHGLCEPTTGACTCEQYYQGVECGSCVNAGDSFPNCVRP